MPTRQNLFDLVARVMQISPADVREDTSCDTISSWDSYNALMLISEVEQAFQMRMTMDEAVAIRSVGDIVRTLAAHGILLDV